MEQTVIKLPFRVSSRLPILLGHGLIPDAGYATFELVKNAYDADATLALVEMINPDDKKKGKIIIQDDGIGMDLKTITESWLVIGTLFQRNRINAGAVSELFKRPPLGEKGIGRFAAHKLGKKVTVITRRAACPEHVIDVDWEKFDAGDQELGAIPATITSRTPQVFVGDNTGTKIIIEGLHSNWTRGDVRNLQRAINSICSPFDSRGDFKPLLEVWPHSHWLDRLQSYETITRNSLFQAEAVIVDCTYYYKYQMNQFPSMLNRLEGRGNSGASLLPIDVTPGVSKETNRIRLDADEANDLAKLGTVRIKLYIYDLDPKILNLTAAEDRTGLRAFLKESGGIRVYRNGMRVFGLGGTGEDWLNLGGRRVQEPSLRIANNQVVGAVFLDNFPLELLSEQTNRQGFVDGPAFRGLKKAILVVLAQIEADRDSDKRRIKAVLSGRAVKLPVIDEIADLREVIQKKAPELVAELSPLLGRIERAYEENRDVLIKAATAGLSLGVVIHEADKRIMELNRALQNDGVSLETIRPLVKSLTELVEGFTLLLRNAPPDNQTMGHIVKSALGNIRHRLKHHGVTVVNNFTPNNDFSLKCSRRMIIAVIMNLLDNAIWWLDARWGGPGVQDTDQKCIHIGPSREFPGGNVLVIADNGPGYSDPPEDLVRPFFSRKPEGSGLGLHIASEVMKEHGGHLLFPDPADLELQPDTDGAVIGLFFPEKVGK